MYLDIRGSHTLMETSITTLPVIDGTTRPSQKGAASHFVWNGVLRCPRLYRIYTGNGDLTALTVCLGAHCELCQYM